MQKKKDLHIKPPVSLPRMFPGWLDNKNWAEVACEAKASVSSGRRIFEISPSQG